MKFKKRNFLLLLIGFSLLLSCSSKTYEILTQAELGELKEPQTINYHDGFGLLIIPVTINRKTYHFLFDTGSSTTIVSREIAQQLHLDSVGEMKVSDSEMRIKKLPVSIIDSLSIGNMKYRDIGVMRIHFQKNPALNCLKIDGIIGMNIISRSNWEVNFDQHSLTAFPLEDSSITREQNQVPFTIKGEIPYIELYANKEKEHFMIDLGNNSDIITIHSDKRFKELKFKKIGVSMAGLFGNAEKDTINMAIAHLSDSSHFKKNRVLVHPHKEKTNNIGTGFLSKYYSTISFNFKKNYLSLQKRKEVDTNYYTYLFSPLLVKNQVIIGSLVHNWPTALELGDTIVAINEVSIKEQSPCQLFKEYWQAKINKIPIHLKVIKNDQIKEFHFTIKTIPKQ